jgi:hypothetical protein
MLLEVRSTTRGMIQLAQLRGCLDEGPSRGTFVKEDHPIVYGSSHDLRRLSKGSTNRVVMLASRKSRVPLNYFLDSFSNVHYIVYRSVADIENFHLSVKRNTVRISNRPVTCMVESCFTYPERVNEPSHLSALRTQKFHPLSASAT